MIMKISDLSSTILLDKYTKKQPNLQSWKFGRVLNNLIVRKSWAVRRRSFYEKVVHKIHHVGNVHRLITIAVAKPQGIRRRAAHEEVVYQIHDVRNMDMPIEIGIACPEDGKKVVASIERITILRIRDPDQAPVRRSLGYGPIIAPIILGAVLDRKPVCPAVCGMFDSYQRTGETFGAPGNLPSLTDTPVLSAIG